MTEKLTTFLNSKGIQKKVIKFTEDQERIIQSKIEEIVKPAFQILQDELNSYNGITSQIMTSKNEHDAITENIQINVLKGNRIIFAYRPEFSVNNSHVYLNGQYCIFKSDVYGESTHYLSTNLNKDVFEIEIQDIIVDFEEIFIEKAELE
jgi:hypothetical protein